ncbi:MAG: hypothetical protein K6E55_06805 [Thermoguttaceae bacterium]|nr:hypothetical protein [Thermoguttaceae bacterium]
MQANPENGREPLLTKFAVMLWKTTLRYYDKIVPPERRDICSEQVFKGIDSNDIRIKEIIIIESREEVIGGVLNESSFCIFGRGNWLQAKTEDCKIDTRVFFASLPADKDDYDSEIVDGITILPTGEIFKALPYSNAKIINAIERGNWGHNKNRDIVECVNNRYLKPFLIYLESKQDIQEESAPAGEPPAPDAPPRDDIQTDDAAPVERSEFEAALDAAGFTDVKGAYLRFDRGDKPVEMKSATKKRLIKILPYISEVKRKKATSNKWGRPDANSSKIQSGRCENIVLEREGVQYIIIYAKCEIDGKEKYRFGVRIHELTDYGKMKSNTYQFFK